MYGTGPSFSVVNWLKQTLIVTLPLQTYSISTYQKLIIHLKLLFLLWCSHHSSTVVVSQKATCSVALQSNFCIPSTLLLICRRVFLRWHSCFNLNISCCFLIFYALHCWDLAKIFKRLLYYHVFSVDETDKLIRSFRLYLGVRLCSQSF